MKHLAHRDLNLCICIKVSLLIFAIQVGCGKEQSSLFEHDHVAPKHWPSSLSDAAAKIQSQCESLENKPMTIDEFAQLLVWIPEVAAETELSEQEWNEVDSACSTVTGLIVRDKQITESNRSTILELATKLENIEKMLLERKAEY